MTPEYVNDDDDDDDDDDVDDYVDDAFDTPSVGLNANYIMTNENRNTHLLKRVENFEKGGNVCLIQKTMIS